MNFENYAFIYSFIMFITVFVVLFRAEETVKKIEAYNSIALSIGGAVMILIIAALWPIYYVLNIIIRIK